MVAHNGSVKGKQQHLLVFKRLFNTVSLLDVPVWVHLEVLKKGVGCSRCVATLTQGGIWGKYEV